jgi:hypothetical protein
MTSVFLRAACRWSPVATPSRHPASGAVTQRQERPCWRGALAG